MAEALRHTEQVRRAEVRITTPPHRRDAVLHRRTAALHRRDVRRRADTARGLHLRAEAQADTVVAFQAGAAVPPRRTVRDTEAVRRRAAEAHPHTAGTQLFIVIE